MRHPEAIETAATQPRTETVDDGSLSGASDAGAANGPVARILMIDDDPAARYFMRKLLSETAYVISEATDGPEGIAKARREQPDLIILDFVMPQMIAFDVLDGLKSDPATRRIPVIVNTSKDLSSDERQRLARETAAVFSKQTLSRDVVIARIREALQMSGAGT
jgi:CheY-like chemotaxis protein